MRASPTLIGAFVVGAIVLGVGALMVFGGGGYFDKEERYILFFRDPVDGLTAGSPVKLSGVKIGEVEDVQLTFIEEEDEFRTPVRIVIFPDRDLSEEENRELVSRLIAKGLRASLTSESFITGQLSISLGFHPETEAQYAGGELPHLELPTITTGLSKFLKDIEQLPIQDLFAEFQGTAASITDRVQSDEVTRLITSAADAIEEYGKLGRQLNEQAGPLLESLTGTSDEAGRLFADGRVVIRNIDGNFAAISDQLIETLRTIDKLCADIDAEVGPTATDLRVALQGARSTLLAATAAADRFSELLGSDSKTLTEIRKALKDFAGATRAVKSLADTLAREPESLLRGKRGR